MRSILILLAVQIAGTLPALGSPGALVSLTGIIDRSEAIVVGKIEAGTVASGSCFLTVQVEKSIKGNLRKGTVLSVSARFGADPRMPGLPVNHERGIFFLQQSAPNMWIMLPLATGSMQNVRYLYFALGDSAKPKAISLPLTSPTERVFAEIIGSLDDADGRNKEAPVDLETEYRFTKVRTPALRQLFAATEASSNPRLKRVALSARLTDGDATAFTEIQSRFATMSPSEQYMVVSHLSYITTLTPAGVKALVGFASSTTGQTQAAAYAALARSHPPAALPVFARLLDSSDMRLVSLGVAGMAGFANDIPPGEHHPSSRPWKYRTDETMRNSGYGEDLMRKEPARISFWKQWWSAHRHEFAE